MKLIQPNCRIQFTSADIDFIVSILGQRAGDAACLTGLLADENTRDIILDDEMLLRAVLEGRGCLAVSTHFYFYILVRSVFRKAGVQDRAVADYVAEMMAEFSRQDRAKCSIPGGGPDLEYFFEMVAALEKADDRAALCLRAHIGNQALFLAGVFPERIRFRESKGFPDLRYYETLGRMNFRAASGSRLAARYDLSRIYAALAEWFQAIRAALNDLSARLLALGDIEPPLALLLHPVAKN